MGREAVRVWCGRHSRVQRALAGVGSIIIEGWPRCEVRRAEAWVE
jgi:hypothetical protein